MFREWLTSSTDTLRRLAGAQLFDFGFLGAGVDVPAFLEQFAPFSRELFTLVGEANTLVVRQLKGQRLNLEPIIFGLLEQLADPGCQGGIRVELGEFGS